jgi:HPt (histidine-containing phosphotransfer) domain-containing protein
MPEMDGYALTLEIRLAEAGKTRLPIVALTANALEGEADHCRSVGMDDYLSKPAPLAALAATLEKWLPKAGHDVAAEYAPPGPAQAPHTRGVVDLQVLAALIGDDAQLLQEFAQDFLVSASQISVELIGACHEERSADVMALAHKLKSSSRSVGALQLGDLCESLECAGRAADVAVMSALVHEFELEMAAVRATLSASTSEEIPVQRFG